MANLPQRAGAWCLNLPGVSEVKGVLSWRTRTHIDTHTLTHRSEQAHKRKHTAYWVKTQTSNPTWGVKKRLNLKKNKCKNKLGEHIKKIKFIEEGLIEAAEQQDKQRFSNGPRLTCLRVYSLPAPRHNTHIVRCAKEPTQLSTPWGAA